MEMGCKTASTVGSNRQQNIQVLLSDKFWVHMVYALKNTQLPDYKLEMALFQKK
jgi:hypothetical protein